MIAFVEGELCFSGDGYVILNAGGIGYQIFTSATAIGTLPSAGSMVRMHTQLAVREDGISLYGFPTREELSLFSMLIQVNGIGPKAALSILSTFSPAQLVTAVTSSDAKTISKAPGVGPKTAGRLILDLKDKLKAWEMENLFLISSTSNTVQEGLPDTDDAREAVLALQALGYTQSEADRAVAAIGDVSGLDTGSILKQALRYLV